MCIRDSINAEYGEEASSMTTPHQVAKFAALAGLLGVGAKFLHGVMFGDSTDSDSKDRTPKGKYTLYYHTACAAFYGRAWPALAMLKHTKAEHKVLPSEQVPANAGFAVPMLGFPDGTTIGQTNAICSALGKAVGLAPRAPSALAKADQLVADAGDLCSEVLQNKPDERISKWLAYLADQLSPEFGFLLPTGLSYADFALYYVCLAIHAKQSKDKMQNVVFPDKLSAWEKSMERLSAVRELNLSKIPILPDKFL
eukprot:TRINITY_DN23372_c0_g1_i2.p1 TRINITY_DN23372_c0_g1~~TRINITY_DN23372_c0_g1_i2.p1  ORF type:complete len:254 (-),score=68.54 TRINITY_DN23372_c0_g1_i2:297-1058(-)